MNILQCIIKSDSSEMYNALTKEMDEHLSCDENIKVYFNTYIMQPYSYENNLYYSPIRVPGATRGIIILNSNNIIQDIHLCDETCFGKIGCYKKSVLSILDKYIGYKILFIDKGVMSWWNTLKK